MPTYDYKCKACGHEFEEFHMMSDPAVEICPQCSGRVERLIGGGAGIIFKGSGFYVTDSKPKKESAPADKPAEKPAGSESSS